MVCCHGIWYIEGCAQLRHRAWPHLEMNVCICFLRKHAPEHPKDSGIFVEDVRVLCLRSQLQQEEDEAGDIPSYFKCSECRSGVHASEDSQEQQVIWTDGASPKNQDDRFRRAGSGIYYGHGHPLNMSAILPGLVQTNQRAELLAVVLACLRDPRPLDIRTDSSYATVLLHGDHG